MLVIVCCPKSLEDEEFLIIQRNAILSWSKLDIEKKIVLVGDEKGNKEFCEKYNDIIIHEPDVEKTKWGTPLIPSIFKLGSKHASEDDSIMYINSDIILLSDFSEMYINCSEFIKENDKYLIVGQRTDIEQKIEIDHESDNWEKDTKNVAENNGKLHASCGIDYFLFSKNTYDLDNMYNFVIGRWEWDRWLVGKCISLNIPTLDITKKVIVVHQKGSYIINNTKVSSHISRQSEEAKMNRFENHLCRGIEHTMYYLDDSYNIVPR